MPVKTIIHTIRHGHTSYNTEKRYAGLIDIPLSSKGIEDCRNAAVRLAEYHFDVAVTSALKRSIETAQLILRANTPIVQSSLCNERHFGIMEGHTWDEVLKFDPPVLMIEVGQDRHTVNARDSEPFEDVWERAKRFRRFLFDSFEAKSILVISHGVFLQMLHGLFRGVSCIESLAKYPGNLELARFCFVDGRLASEQVEKLIRPEVEVKF